MKLIEKAGRMLLPDKPCLSIPSSTSSLHSFIWFFLKCFSNASRGQSIMMGNVDKSMILVLIEFTCCVGDETCYTRFFLDERPSGANVLTMARIKCLAGSR